MGAQPDCVLSVTKVVEVDEADTTSVHAASFYRALDEGHPAAVSVSKSTPRNEAADPKNVLHQPQLFEVHCLRGVQTVTASAAPLCSRIVMP